MIALWKYIENNFCYEKAQEIIFYKNVSEMIHSNNKMDWKWFLS